MYKEEKKKLRKTIAQKKTLQSVATLSALSSTLLKQLEESAAFIRAHHILLYYSLPDEVCTHAFIEKWSKEKNILLPVVKGNDLELRQYRGKESLHIGAYHIMEPGGPVWTNLQQIELSIVPGVGFDRRGHRLGRGKGYYDRLLPQLTSYNIGICFGFQLLDAVPTEEFDITMDEVWTEKGKV